MAVPHSRSRSSVLTELQKQIARILLSASPDPELALAGGAALISLGLVERDTIDLDLFTTSREIEGLVAQMEIALADSGLDVERLVVTPTFVRVVVSCGGDSCQVDVAQDARLMPAEPGPLGRTLAADELAGDKVLALFARALARDFVDVYFLAKRFGKQRMLELAAEKDSGFDEGAFAQMLAAIDRLDREEFSVDDANLDDLRVFFAAWRAEL